MREGRTGQHGDRRIRAGLSGDMVEQRAAPPRCPSSKAPAACHFRRRVEDAAHMLGGRHDQPCVGIGNLGQVGRRPDGRTERAAGQEQAVLVGCVDALHDLRLTRPQQGLAATGRGDLRQRRAPCAAADDCESLDACALTPAPRTFSALSSSGYRACAGASRPSILPAAKRSAPPRRSSRHCRCIASAGGTLEAPAFAPRKPGEGLAHGAIGSDASGNHQRSRFGPVQGESRPVDQ